MTKIVDITRGDTPTEIKVVFDNGITWSFDENVDKYFTCCLAKSVRVGDLQVGDDIINLNLLASAPSNGRN